MSSFEQNKNIKAATFTIIVIGLILTMSFMIAWSPPSSPEPKEEEGMEVNLGDSETGLGEIQPLIEGAPANEENTEVAAAVPLAKAAEVEKEIETNEADKEAPPVVIDKPTKKPTEKVKPKTEKKIEPLVKPKVEKKPEAKPAVAKPAEVKPAPKPKYLYSAENSSGNGGNNTDGKQPGKDQGIKGGKGDQGKTNGDPDSDNYIGSGGTGNGSGVSVSRGLKGRKINRFPNLQDDFPENAKVAVDVTVDAAGNVVNAIIQPKGTTTGNTSMKNIALKKASSLKFSVDNEGPEKQIGTVIFNFRVKD